MLCPKKLNRHSPDLFLKFGGFFMFFFRAVIYLLMQHRIYPYIAYRGIAGSQLKKSLPMQRYFLPCNQKYNLHLTEYVSPITVEVTEPLRFFFCRFLSECAVGKNGTGNRLSRHIEPGTASCMVPRASIPPPHQF